MPMRVGDFKDCWYEFLPKSGINIRNGIYSKSINIEPSNPTRPQIDFSLQDRRLLGEEIIQAIKVAI